MENNIEDLPFTGKLYRKILDQINKKINKDELLDSYNESKIKFGVSNRKTVWKITITKGSNLSSDGITIVCEANNYSNFDEFSLHFDSHYNGPSCVFVDGTNYVNGCGAISIIDPMRHLEEMHFLIRSLMKRFKIKKIK